MLKVWRRGTATQSGVCRFSSNQLYQNRIRARREDGAVTELAESSISPTVCSASGGNTAIRGGVRRGRNAREAYSSAYRTGCVAIAPDRTAGLSVIIQSP